MFSELGADVVDTDEISHEITGSGGSAMHAITSAFGVAMTRTDGSLDRTAMRDLVFNNPDQRKRLEDILHPLIRAEAHRRVTASSAPYVLLVVPLLHESSGYRDLVRRVLVIDCDESRQITRTMDRSQLTEEAVRAIMAAQIPRQRRLALADDIIDNNGDMVHLRAQVGKLHRQYLELAASSPASS